jgi:hypothetical protein
MKSNENIPGVIYIMGLGRSGSSILGIILGNHPDIENVGELKKWPDHHGLPRDRELKEYNLDFWHKVLMEYQNDSGKMDFRHFKEMQDDVESNDKYIPYLFGYVRHKKVKLYKDHIRKLLKSIYNISRKTYVVDSSKSICRGIQFYHYKEIPVFIIYIVRDPRGIVWSFRKRGVEQKQKQIIRTVFDYALLNAAGLSFYLFSDKERVCLLRYEDLVERPDKAMTVLEKFLSIDMRDLVIKIKEGQSFNILYMIDGNRIRKEENIVIQPDLAWKKQMNLFTRFWIYIVTLPLNLFFRYLP